MSESQELRMLLTVNVEHDTYKRLRLLRLTAAPIHHEDESPRNIGHFSRFEPHWELADLALEMWTDEEWCRDPERRTDWALLLGQPRPEYIRAGDVNLERAEAMVKALRSIHKKMDRMSEELGEASGFADLAIRFGRALGITKYGRRVGEARGLYSNSEWRWMNASDAKSFIDTHISRFVRESRTPKEVNATA